jgi:hypothetical protein
MSVYICIHTYKRMHIYTYINIHIYIYEKVRYLSARMLSDRDSPLVTNQLFVARSKRLRELMKVYHQADQSSKDSWGDQQVDIIIFD